MSRRPTFEENWLIGQSLPSIRPVFKPLMPRHEWEQLPRWRRIIDRLLLEDPPKGYDEPRGLFDD